MTVTLNPKPNHSHGSVQQSKDRKKARQVRSNVRFCSLFSSITMVQWCIMNSCHKVTNHKCSRMTMILKTKPNYLNESVQKSKDRHVNVRVLLTVFFDCKGLVHHEFLPQGNTVNKEYYLEVICRLREEILQKRKEL